MRVLIADDERVARKGLRALLAREPDVEIVGEAASGGEVLRLLQAVPPPDLLLLDVQMPQMSGLDVVAAIGAEAMPLVIFVTAHDEHAVRAFELHALDYLVKPCREERFRAAISRARDQLRRRRAGDFRDRLEAWLRTERPGTPAPAPRSYAARIKIEADGRIRFATVRDIRWIEAQDYCVLLHMTNERILRRGTLKQFLAELDPRQFVRVHRSAAINVRYVKELTITANGTMTARLTDGTDVPVARPCRAALEDRLRAAP